MKKTNYQQPTMQQVRLQHQQMLMEASGATVPGNQVTSSKQGYDTQQPTTW